MTNKNSLSILPLIQELFKFKRWWLFKSRVDIENHLKRYLSTFTTLQILRDFRISITQVDGSNDLKLEIYYRLYDPVQVFDFSVITIDIQSRANIQPDEKILGPNDSVPPPDAVNNVIR